MLARSSAWMETGPVSLFRAVGLSCGSGAPNRAGLQVRVWSGGSFGFEPSRWISVEGSRIGGVGFV